jgi:beta-glucosidase
MITKMQKAALKTRLGIPIIYGIDAVHGNNNAYNATIFPHNIGLGATRDASLVKLIGRATALETRATGIPYAFAPCVAVSNPSIHPSLYTYIVICEGSINQPFTYVCLRCVQVCRDPRWGRCYESFSEDTKLVQLMTASVVTGLQGDVSSRHPKGVPAVAGSKNVAGCAKHYVGDGGTKRGINENNTVMNFHDLMRIHMPPYDDAVIKGISSIMISYSSWNGVKMHENKFLITQILKERMHFRVIHSFIHLHFRLE